MIERATTPSGGRPTMHPSWTDEGDREELFSAFNGQGIPLRSKRPNRLVMTTRQEAERRRRWRRFIACAVAAVVWAALWWAWPAAAAGGTTMRMLCHDASEIAEQLSKRYGEVPVAFGFQSNGNLFQVYSSEEHGTWTVVSTSPGGMSCVVAAGKGWEQLPALVVEEPA